VGFLSRILGGSRGSAAKQEADPDVLARENDPRGGLQSDDYRTADPRGVVEEGGTVMSGPAGAPQEATTANERRDEQRDR
jgi:hypothetical protein